MAEVRVAFASCFRTNPPTLPIDALREGSMADFEVVELAAASARADAFTYGEPFHLLASALDKVAEKLRDHALCVEVLALAEEALEHD